jgi:uncharacterized protein (TIRG00374 family)
MWRLSPWQPVLERRPLRQRRGVAGSFWPDSAPGDWFWRCRLSFRWCSGGNGCRSRYARGWPRWRRAFAALRRRDVAVNLLASIVLMALDVVSLYVLACAFEPVAFAAVAFAFPWILLTNLVPITPAGLGVREGTAVALLHTCGVQVATAVNATLLLFVINSVLPALIGWHYLGRRAPVPSDYQLERPT